MTITPGLGLQRFVLSGELVTERTAEWSLPSALRRCCKRALSTRHCPAACARRRPAKQLGSAYDSAAGVMYGVHSRSASSLIGACWSCQHAYPLHRRYSQYPPQQMCSSPLYLDLLPQTISALLRTQRYIMQDTSRPKCDVAGADCQDRLVVPAK